MREEYNYTLTVPLADLQEVLSLLDSAKGSTPQMRISRKPDTKSTARFYLSFPFRGQRTDLQFSEWIEGQLRVGWDLFGPNYGIWGLND